jgi:hypothetical protein
MSPPNARSGPQAEPEGHPKNLAAAAKQYSRSKRTVAQAAGHAADLPWKAALSAPGYVIPAALRGGRLIPRQQPGRREPMKVTRGAFQAAGVPLPEDPRQWNACQLSQREGWPWSPALDEHTRRRGSELLGFVLVDVDNPMAVDGTPMVDALRWLSDRAVEAGAILDLSATVTVRTPGHPDSGHLPGWHLWFAADPDRPVRMGPLTRCRAVEVKQRGTCPGSPGYRIHHAPAELPVLPRWLSELAGRPRQSMTIPGGDTVSAVSAWKRLHGVLGRVLGAERGERNQMLFWGAMRAGELVAAGTMDAAAAERALCEAAADIGLVGEDGERAVLATIRSGLERAAVAYAAR